MFTEYLQTKHATDGLKLSVQMSLVLVCLEIGKYMINAWTCLHYATKWWKKTPHTQTSHV